MTSLFHNPCPLDRNLDEGIVLQVDALRSVCRIRTLEGRVYDQAMWLGGVDPLVEDRVLVSTGLGLPIVLGKLPKLGFSENAFPTKIAGGAQVDLGNYSVDTAGVVPNPDLPSDRIPGDVVAAQREGALVAILKAGSVLLRASRLSEILISKLGLLVRVVSKNWEHFSDPFSDVAKNFKNRLYRYTGYAPAFSDGKISAYSYHTMQGDVAAAEFLAADYNSLTTEPPAVPSTGALLFKEKVTPPGGGPTSTLMYRTLNVSGEEEVWIKNGSVFTRVKSTGTTLTLSYNDQHTITINPTKIELLHSGGAVTRLQSSGITHDFGSGHIDMSSSSVNTTFGGHFVTVSSGGVAMG
jgi:hypothetical protein